MDTKPTIGLIGLGIMGRPMARNLMKAGYPLVVHDVTRAAVEELVAEGATAGTSPRQVAETTDVLITMLPDSPQVREVYLGTDGAFEALRPGWLAIDMSSIAPSTARELAERAADAGADDARRPRERRRQGRDRRDALDHGRRDPRRPSSGHSRSSRPWARRSSTSARRAPARWSRSATRSRSRSSSRRCPRPWCWAPRQASIPPRSPTSSRAAWRRRRSSSCVAPTCSAAPSTRASGSASTRRTSRTPSISRARSTSPCRRRRRWTS